MAKWQEGQNGKAAKRKKAIWQFGNGKTAKMVMATWQWGKMGNGKSEERKTAQNGRNGKN